MPVSERKQLLRDLRLTALYAHVINDEEMLDDSLDVYEAIASSRFLMCQTYQSRDPHYFMEVFPALDDTAFRSMFRTTRQGFHAVYDIIKDHPVFKSNSRCKQADPTYQLAVAMARFGCNGNGGSVAKIQSRFEIAAGTVALYTARVVKALKAHEAEWIVWPDKDRRVEIGQVMELEGFPGCVGFIDGTTIPLSQKPAMDGEVYYDRKKRYPSQIEGISNCSSMYDTVSHSLFISLQDTRSTCRLFATVIRESRPFTSDTLDLVQTLAFSKRLIYTKRLSSTSHLGSTSLQTRHTPYPISASRPTSPLLPTSMTILNSTIA
jgi:hypothetical protein